MCTGRRQHGGYFPQLLVSIRQTLPAIPCTLHQIARIGRNLFHREARRLPHTGVHEECLCKDRCTNMGYHQETEWVKE